LPIGSPITSKGEPTTLLRAIARAFRFAVLVFLAAESAAVAAGAEPLAVVAAGSAPDVGHRSPDGGSAPCPCTLFGDAAPGRASAGDADGVELGVRFQPDVDGFVTAIRFYKGPRNRGTHVGHLWTASGTLLGSVVFADETASGWQQASLPAPIPVTAGTLYVASYFAPAGGYAFDENFFANGAVRGGPLHAPGAAIGPNGVFHYGASEFPEQTHNAANYWVDVVFITAPGGDEAAAVSPPTPASVRITIPGGGIALPGSLTIGVDASDSAGLRSVTLYANGIRINTFTCSGPTCTGAFAWTTDRYLPPGSHTLFAVATNAEGVHHRSATVTVIR
jgi:hypothetical protein